MLKEFLEKHGYIHHSEVMDHLKANPLNEEQILRLAADTLVDLYGNMPEKKEEVELFSRLNQVEGFTDYLRATLANDVKRFFKASSPAEQLQIRGAYARTLYLKGRLLKKQESEEDPVSLPNVRYTS